MDYSKYNEQTLFDTVDIETTTECNRKCWFCPVSKYPRGKNLMDEKLFKKIIDQLAELNCTKIFTPTLYGEPLLDCRIVELLGYVKDKLKNVTIELYTNGDFLTYELKQKLKGIVSVYIMNKPNGIEAPFPLTSRGGLIKEANVPIRKMCNRPAHILTINYKGDVILCCEDYFGKHIFGNLKTEKLIDIWNKKEFYENRKGLLDGNPMKDICDICFGVDTTWRDRL